MASPVAQTTLDPQFEAQRLTAALIGYRSEARRALQPILRSIDQATPVQRADLARIFREIAPRNSSEIDTSIQVLESLRPFFVSGFPQPEVLRAIKLLIDLTTHRYAPADFGPNFAVNVPLKRDLHYTERALILLDTAISDRTVPRTIQQYSRVNNEGNPTDNPIPHEITFSIHSGAKFQPQYLTNDFIRGLYNLTQFDMVSLNDVILPALRDASFDYKSETLERILDEFRPLLSTPRRGNE